MACCPVEKGQKSPEVEVEYVHTFIAVYMLQTRNIIHELQNTQITIAPSVDKG